VPTKTTVGYLKRKGMDLKKKEKDGKREGTEPTSSSAKFQDVWLKRVAGGYWGANPTEGIAVVLN